MALRWPETDVRNVRHGLTAERKGEIARAAKAEIGARSDATLEATAFLNRAQRKPATSTVGAPGGQGAGRRFGAGASGHLGGLRLRGAG